MLKSCELTLLHFNFIDKVLGEVVTRKNGMHIPQICPSAS